MMLHPHDYRKRLAVTVADAAKPDLFAYRNRTTDGAVTGREARR